MCGGSPCVNPSFCRACRRADRELTAKRKAEGQRAAINEQHARAAASTVEALAYQLRAGPSALREPSAQRRLSEFDERQVRRFCKRLTKERWGVSNNGGPPPRVPPWKPAEVKSLVALWSNLHG
jgi:hypothetical protein